MKDKLAKWFLIGALFIFIVGSIFIYNATPHLLSEDASLPVLNWFSKGISFFHFIAGMIISIVSIILFITAIKRWGSVKIFHFKENELEHSITKGGSLRKSETTAKSHFTGAKASASGHVNNDPRYKVKLLGQRHLTLCHFVSEEVAYKLEDWVNHWLQDGNNETDSEPSDTTSSDYGYGAPMKL